MSILFSLGREWECNVTLSFLSPLPLPSSSPSNFSSSETLLVYILNPGVRWKCTTWFGNETLAYIKMIPAPPLSYKASSLRWIFRWGWCDCTITPSHGGGRGCWGKGAGQPTSQCGVFVVGLSLSLGAAVHADVAVVLYKAPNDMQRHNDLACTRSINRTLWMSLRKREENPDWRNVHINYFYLNEFKGWGEGKWGGVTWKTCIILICTKNSSRGQAPHYSSWDKQVH